MHKACSMAFFSILQWIKTPNQDAFFLYMLQGNSRSQYYNCSNTCLAACISISSSFLLIFLLHLYQICAPFPYYPPFLAFASMTLFLLIRVIAQIHIFMFPRFDKKEVNLTLSKINEATNGVCHMTNIDLPQKDFTCCTIALNYSKNLKHSNY